MFTVLGWIPIVGPIIDGIVSIFKQKTNTDLAKQQDVNKTDVSVIQSRVALAIAMKDDPGTRIARDIIMYPVAAWTFLEMSYLMFNKGLPGVFWEPLAIPANIQYMPYAVFAYLFATAWRR